MPHYLLLGQDIQAKDEKIAQIKTSLFSACPRDALTFDSDTLHAQGLDSETLKKSLLALPAIAQNRLVLIRTIHKLSQHNKELLREFLEKPYSPTVLILESDEWNGEEPFVKEIRHFVQISQSKTKSLLNVFDLTRAMGMHKTAESLNVLAQLLAQGDYPLQLMGGIVWYWKQLKGKVPAAVFRKGLLALQEADINIKRSRLPAEQALEVLVIKLLV